MEYGLKESNSENIKRLTALWGFSEAAFGGILHTLRIPFSGIFIGCAAVIFISLIAYSSKDKSVILRSTLIVILVKAFVSPYSPLPSYLSVFMQGAIGYIIFKYTYSEKAASILLGFFAMLFSALQKLFVLTILFGNSLWDSVDQFVKFILDQVGMNPGNSTLSFSLILTSFYLAVHILAGIFVGIKISEIPNWLKTEFSLVDSKLIFSIPMEDYFETGANKKPKKWWIRPTGIAVLIISITLLAASLLSENIGTDIGAKIIIMLLRSLLITIIWFVYISPLAFRYFQKFVKKNQFMYASQINEVTELFPNFKRIVNYSWKSTSKYKNIDRIKKFLANSLALLLIVKINQS